MEPFRLIHITDFHIDDPNSDKENLRNGYYREFLNGLIEAIYSVFGVDAINGIVATGDFINKYNYHNYSHVDKIIQHLLKKLNLSNERVCVCPGNHDIDYEADKTDSGKARDEYRKFANKYSFGTVVSQKERYKFTTIDDIYFISIDNTLGSNGKNSPGNINTPEVDEIVSDVIMNQVPEDKLLVIASHFPLYINSRSRLLAEEKNWVDNHYWSSGNPLVSRILNQRKIGQTLWLYGDAHLPDFFSISEQNHFLMTGMIGGNYLNRVSTSTDLNTGKETSEAYEIKTEVKIVEFLKIDEAPKIHTFRYVSQSFKNLPSNGLWEHAPSVIRLEQAITQPRESNAMSVGAQTVLDHRQTITDNTIVVISTSVQKAIIQRVQEQNLYSVGRYVTSEDKVTLGWVSLNKLFEDYQILTQCVEKSVKWFGDLKVDANLNNTLIIGLDFWGSIISTQLSVRMIIENTCISTRNHNKDSMYNKSYESTINSLCSRKKMKNVIIVTDVITTGNTVHEAYNLIKEKLDACGASIDKWIIVSLLADVKQTRKIKFDEFFAVGTLCGDIRFPTINSDELPDEMIWPPDLNVRK